MMSLVNLFTAAGRALAQRLHERRVYTELMALDDHVLADIGLRRAQIRALAEGGRVAAETDMTVPEAGFWSAQTRLIGQGPGL
jgi:uncharacterized protein YjiS (DUF1127 family)